MVYELNNSPYITPSISNPKGGQKNAFIIVLSVTALVAFGFAFVNRKKTKKH